MAYNECALDSHSDNSAKCETAGGQMAMCEKELAGLTDSELVALCQNGREDAFTVLLRRYQPLVCSQVAAWHLKPQDAEDFTQEAWIALFHAIHCFNPEKGASFSSFLKVCIQNKLTSAARRHQAADRFSTVSLDDEKLPPDSLTVDDPTGSILEEKSTEDFLVLLRDQLSPRETRVLTLFLQGLSYREIAAQLSVSVKTVDNALCRIRRKVRQLMPAEPNSAL